MYALFSLSVRQLLVLHSLGLHLHGQIIVLKNDIYVIWNHVVVVMHEDFTVPARAIKYGGNSPRAVPAPYTIQYMYIQTYKITTQ